MKPLARKIRTLRTTLNLKQREFGQKLAHPVPQATISKWETGTQEPDAQARIDLAALSGESLAEFMGLPEHGVVPTVGRRVQVVGAVAAGEWMEQPEWAEGDRYWVAEMLPERYAKLPIHGLEVRGDSMNRYYPDGSIVYVTPLSNLPGAPKSGQRVVVVRKDHDGTYETTVKEYVVDADGNKWLWPRSTSPLHQEPLQYAKRGGRTELVTIAGVVVAGLAVAI